MPNNIVTNCQECKFAITEGDEQTGCEAGQIELFGESVTPAYNENGKFFIINDLCMFSRPKDWGGSVEQAAKQMEMKYNCFIYAAGETSIKGLHKTLQSIFSQKILPELLVVTTLDLPLKEIDLTTSLLGNFPKWKIENLVEPDEKKWDYWYRSIHHYKSPWGLFMDCGSELEEGWIERVNKSFVDGPSNFISAIDKNSNKLTINAVFMNMKNFPDKEEYLLNE